MPLFLKGLNKQPQKRKQQKKVKNEAGNKKMG